MLRVPMTDDMTPAGPVGAPMPYDMALMRRLPLTLLDHEITVAPAATETVGDLTSTPAPGALALPTAEPGTGREPGDQAGSSDNVFSGNCGQGEGVGVANGCGDDDIPPQPPVDPPGHGGEPPGHGGEPPGHDGEPPGHGGQPPGRGRGG
jgi:hypothetical protein